MSELWVMSDVKHARDAEAFLKDAKDAEGGSVEPIELALVHANLAMARAAREIDTTIRIGFRDVVDKLAGPPAAHLVLLEQKSGHVWVNAHHIVSIKADEEYPDDTAIRMSDGLIYLIKGNVVDVSATIFQVVGSW